MRSALNAEPHISFMRAKKWPISLCMDSHLLRPPPLDVRRQIDRPLRLAPFRAVREAVGDRLDLAVDLAGMWTLAPALQIARALAPFELIWLEDPLRISALDAVGRLSEAMTMPLAGYDQRCGLPAYIDLIERGRVALVRMDLGWVGGITEALRVAAYAEARGLGVVLHDCAGPVALASSVHAALHLSNAVIQECVRAYARDIYPQIARGLPTLEGGTARPADGPGHGLELSEEYLVGARRRRSSLSADGRWRSDEGAAVSDPHA